MEFVWWANFNRTPENVHSDKTYANLSINCSWFFVFEKSYTAGWKTNASDFLMARSCYLPRYPNSGLRLKFDVGFFAGKYPGEDGFVAPGMSAHYNIRFMPDSLAEFEDEVEILSQAGSPLIVKIEAKRIPPVLTSTRLRDSEAAFWIYSRGFYAQLNGPVTLNLSLQNL